jgi:hypothetical protein
VAKSGMAWLNQELKSWNSKDWNQEEIGIVNMEKDQMDSIRDKIPKVVERLSGIKETPVYGHYVDPNDALVEISAGGYWSRRCQGGHI